MASSESETRSCGVMNELSVYIHKASPHHMYILQYQGVMHEHFPEYSFPFEAGFMMKRKTHHALWDYRKVFPTPKRPPCSLSSTTSKSFLRLSIFLQNSTFPKSSQSQHYL